MASTLLTPPHSPLSFPRTRLKPAFNAHKPTRVLIICGNGPRSSRGPLLKGRILSTEAILAIQSLKRSHKSDPTKPLHVSSPDISRLLKSDLIAVLRELLRQDECRLALAVFAVIRSEPSYAAAVDFSLLADVVLALSRNGLFDDVDRLVAAVDDDVAAGAAAVRFEDKKGLGRLVRALIEGNRREATVRIYRVIRRAGWGGVGSGIEVDEYLGRVLVRGFKRFGEVELAKEVDSILETYLNSCLGR